MTIVKNPQELWIAIERHSRAVIVVPALVGLIAMVVTGRMLLFQLGVVWFAAAIFIFTAVETLSQAGRQRRYGKKALLSALLQYGGYSLCAGSLAAYFAGTFWTTYRPQWLVLLMLAGLAAFLASGFVPRSAKHKP